MTTETFITPENQVPNKPVRLVFIMDRSGSMHRIASDAIGGFNSFVEQQKALGEPATLTLVLFDDRYEVAYKNVPLELVEPLTNETYRPRGGTALCDAIGRTLSIELDSLDSKVIAAVMTDGQENASREHSHGSVKSLIKRTQDELGWEIIFLGANMDAVSVAGSYGIKLSNVATFDANAKGALDAINTVSAGASMYRAGARGFSASATYESLKSADSGMHVDTTGVYADLSKAYNVKVDAALTKTEKR